MCLARILVGLLVIRGLWVLGDYVWRLPPQYWLMAGPVDPVAATDVRLAPVRDALRPWDSVNYLSDRQAGVNYSPLEVAQYALAPAVLETHRSRPLVVADFTSAEALEAALARGEYRIRGRFGPGVAVLERMALP